MEQTILSPSDFVALVNQSLEYAYPVVVVEGELSDFRVSKNRWLYFNLKDEQSNVAFFGSVYNLPGPLEDGILLRVVGAPHLHNRFGFSVSVRSITPVGEGALKKAAELLARKLTAEGLFAPERKRLLPAVPRRIGLITAAKSAAYADFIKILNGQWGGVEVLFVDSYVQGEQAPAQLVTAIERLNQLAPMPDVLVMTRGGGSLEDLAAFNDERLVRAVAASRIPTLIAIGHEVDLSLAELAADARASTPSNAAHMVVPDRQQVLGELASYRRLLAERLLQPYDSGLMELRVQRQDLSQHIKSLLSAETERLTAWRRLIDLFDPKAALRRGYAIINKNGRHIKSVRQLAEGDKLSAQLSDGTIGAIVQEVT